MRFDLTFSRDTSTQVISLHENRDKRNAYLRRDEMQLQQQLVFGPKAKGKRMTEGRRLLLVEKE